ncbi:MAG: hypothetical protein HY076_07445 [Candidatus Eisenbacteria bacterium]|uniref:histidine kinase n=1 Tax=Eiseniibacteriota bacterium TaxID=2212470 RepID=A0A9D6LAX7_UNCEI|nr:hypothetical protein [Candidatus Eisenbacteria bacterium]
MSGALATEFGRRLETLAKTAASQVSPDDVREVRLFGEDANSYLVLQVLLEGMRSSTGLRDAAALDSTGLVLYDSRDAERRGEPSPLDSVAHATLAAALAGRSGVSDVYTAPRTGGEARRAGFAPVAAGGHVIGVVAVESHVDYLPVLADFGRTLWLAALLAALGIAVLAIAVVRTVNSAARLERRLSRAENLAAMGRLTATMAHEIKNPLAIIRGSAERLGKLAPDAQRWADSVVEETDRLSRTVGRYLQFARGENAGAGSGAGDVAQMLRETLDLLEGEFRSRRMTLDRPTSLAAPLPVPLDNESLKQVFLNLMLNALDAVSEGGRLAVAVDERRDAIAVTFRDDGPGIPAETLAQIGAPFVTTKVKGSGLGLFLSRRLVQSAGGRLDIESHVGRGTTCTVRLPRRKG